MQVEKSVGAASQGTPQPSSFAGKWINELKSTMTLEQSGSALTGAYESAVSEAGTKTTGKLVGFVNGHHIAFTVRWDDFEAITCWVGHLTGADSSASIQTLWQMTSHPKDGNAEWASINAGADSFTRKPN